MDPPQALASTNKVARPRVPAVRVHGGGLCWSFPWQRLHLEWATHAQHDGHGGVQGAPPTSTSTQTRWPLRHPVRFGDILRPRNAGLHSDCSDESAPRERSQLITFSWRVAGPAAASRGALRVGGDPERRQTRTYRATAALARAIARPRPKHRVTRTHRATGRRARPKRRGSRRGQLPEPYR
jgi:hypothetical protein